MGDGCYDKIILFLGFKWFVRVLLKNLKFLLKLLDILYRVKLVILMIGYKERILY